MERLLICIPLSGSLVLLGVFGLFCAFHYCKRGEPERILLTGIGIIAILMAIFVVIGILNS